MDFFGSQDVARKKTGRLVALFALAVVLIVASTYVVVSLGLNVAGAVNGIWHPELLLAVVVAVVAIVAIGSLYKIAQLSNGGSVVAEALGGRKLQPNTTDRVERRLLNIVEEMALASGTVVPAVYLMDSQPAINAFAAGHAPDNAVVGVTRGCAERLNREQLQGVIAHEFSHILNGDMRLNIRLMGVLHGILVIGLIGHGILRVMSYSGRGRRGNDKAGGALLALLAVGAGLMAVGFIGTLIGNIIKAAVSRQREYLADASAVQFTRNPLGVSGALKQIGAVPEGAKVDSRSASEVSHMFFARAISGGFASMVSTHPPLDDRIQRIEPGWDGVYPEPAPLIEPDAPPEIADADADDEELLIPELLAGTVSPALVTRSSGQVREAIEQIGNPTAEHVRHAGLILDSLPASIAQAAREPYGSRALVYGLLIHKDPELRREQMDYLWKEGDPAVVDLVGRLLDDIERLPADAHLSVVDLATPALRDLSPAQRERFQRIVDALALADRKQDVFEWALERLLIRHVHPRPSRRRRTARRRLAPLVSIVLSSLAHRGHDEPEPTRAAFERGKAMFDQQAIGLLDRDEGGFATLDAALLELEPAPFAFKRKLLEACAVIVAADEKVRVEEVELLRGVAAALDCPMPPLLDVDESA